MPPVVVPPKTIRSLSRYRYVRTEAKADPALACWNWALTGLDAAAPPVNVLYDYVNGFNTTIHDVDVAFPAMGHGVRGDLVTLEGLWAPQRGGAYDRAKGQLIEQYSKEMATLVTQIYGLPVSQADTGIEICMHFEASLERSTVIRGADRHEEPEDDRDFAERQDALGIGFEHWWLRFKSTTIVETFPSIPVLQMARNEQAHGHRAIWRASVSRLHPEHITYLNRFITAIRGGHTAFQHRPGPQAWVADATRNTCTWCDTQFSFFTRKHHCRSCGKIFCSECAFKTEAVAHPSVSSGASVAGTERVCDTCYTGNT